MILSIIGIVLGIVAIGLFIWLNNLVKKITSLFEEELDNTHQGMNAVMNDFSNYQIDTDRKIAELEKQLEIQTKSQDKKMEKHLKELPFIIGKVVGQIELAQDTINRKM